MGTQTNNSVVRVFEILRHFSKQENELTASAIASKSGMHVSTVHRFLLTLEKIGAVARSRNGRFQMGMLMAELGDQVSIDKVLSDTVTPYVNNLVNRFRETVHVAIFHKNDVVYINKGESPRSLRINTYVGKVLDAYSSGVGKVLLAGCSDQTIRDYIQKTEMVALTKNTIVDSNEFFDEIMKIRQHGYGLDNEETEEGLCCIAVPIKDEHNEVLAAISISGPSSRMLAGLINMFYTELLATSKAITNRLYPNQNDKQHNNNSEVA